MSRSSTLKLAQAISNAKLLNVPYASRVVQDVRPEILMSIAHRFMSER